MMSSVDTATTAARAGDSAAARSPQGEAGTSDKVVQVSSYAVREMLGVGEIDPRSSKTFSVVLIALDKGQRLTAERGEKDLDLCMWSLCENLCDAGFAPEHVLRTGRETIVAFMPEADWEFTQARVDRALERHHSYGATLSDRGLWHASAGLASYPRDERRITELIRWANRALSIAQYMGSDASFSWAEEH